MCKSCAGQDQPKLATAALTALFTGTQSSHSVTLRTTAAHAEARWTQFDMWKVTDHADEKPAVLIKTLDVTRQRELELQLQSARDLLQQ